MSSTIAIVIFEEPEGASEALKSLEKLQKDKLVDLEDAVVVVKSKEGKVKVKETTDFTAGGGAAAGGALGFIIGLMLGGPIGGAILGVAAGWFTGKQIDLGVSQEKIDAIASELAPGSSALFVQVIAVRKEGVLAALMRDKGGRLYEFDLSDASETDIDNALAGTNVRH